MKPLDRRRWLRFALFLPPLLALLAWPLPLFGRGFRVFVCSGVNALVMNSDAEPDVARLLPDERAGREWHVTAAVWNRPGRFLRFQMDVDLHQSAYLPLMLFVSLVVAGGWAFGHAGFLVRRQLAGVVLLLARSSLRFILLSRQVDDLPHRGALDVVLQLANLSLGAPLAMAYAFPLLLWLLLFRRALPPRVGLAEG